MKIIKKATALFLMAVMLFLCIASLTSCTSLKSTKEESETVMTIGGYEVPYELYRYFVMNYRDTMPEDTDDEAIRENVLLSLRDIYAVFSLCADYGVDFDGDYISAAVDSTVENSKSEYKNDKEYKASLAEKYMNDSVYRLLEKKNAASDELYYAMINSGDINTDKDFMTALIASDGFICVKQILVVGEAGHVTEGDTTYTAKATHTDAEAEGIAAAAQARAAAGEDFDALVAEYGESLYMFGNTDGYYLCHGMWDETNEEAAFALAEGEVSPVIKSDKGFSVFKRLPKDQSYIDSHFDDICDNYYSAVFMLALEARSAELELETTGVYDSLVISEMK